MPWSAEEMHDGQRQGMDTPAYARAAYKGLLQKRLEEDLCWIVRPFVPVRTQSVKRLNWIELNWPKAISLCRPLLLDSFRLVTKRGSTLIMNRWVYVGSLKLAFFCCLCRHLFHMKVILMMSPIFTFVCQLTQLDWTACCLFQAV